MSCAVKLAGVTDSSCNCFRAMQSLHIHERQVRSDSETMQRVADIKKALSRMLRSARIRSGSAGQIHADLSRCESGLFKQLYFLSVRQQI